jgi:predicted enzyme related to lactoylglutathione lyase
VFALWEGKQNPGAVMNVNGALCWFELHTKDLERAKSFYTKMFGWTAKGSPEYTEWHLGEKGLGGMMAMRPEEGANTPPYWLAYFLVDDVDATVAKAKSLGGKVVAPAMDMPDVGRFAVLADPQGAVSAVFKSAMKK